MNPIEAKPRTLLRERLLVRKTNVLVLRTYVIVCSKYLIVLSMYVLVSKMNVLVRRKYYCGKILPPTTSNALNTSFQKLFANPAHKGFLRQCPKWYGHGENYYSLAITTHLHFSSPKGFFHRKLMTHVKKQNKAKPSSSPPKATRRQCIQYRYRYPKYQMP